MHYPHALHCRAIPLRSPALAAGRACVPAGRAWPAVAGRLRERDAARLHIGPRQAARP
ncbi:hypothetical protein [Delftia sp. PS-11]|uniref:hypothetical protein n=1 Tax=Delftia sp. PS-11 TaxID=2767222 RepID=UPI0024567E37|nr:hypothetical protein [Delftia sp. PS-11]